MKMRMEELVKSSIYNKPTLLEEHMCPEETSTNLLTFSLAASLAQLRLSFKIPSL